jgi:hypothetical protein
MVCFPGFAGGGKDVTNSGLYQTKPGDIYIFSSGIPHGYSNVAPDSKFNTFQLGLKVFEGFLEDVREIYSNAERSGWVKTQCEY